MRAAAVAMVVATALLAMESGRTQEPPEPRPQRYFGGSLESLFESSGISGEFGAILFRLDDGSVVDILSGSRGFPPASAIKILAAARALEVLGPQRRFATRLVASGILGDDGVLAGDLVLQGGGDPTLDNNDLARMADALRGLGLRGVRGRFLFDDRSLPANPFIDPNQRDHVAANTGYGGLNLNFNRVRLYGVPGGDGGLRGRLTAHADGLEVEVDSVHAVVYPDDGDPSLEHHFGRDGEYWIVEESVLRQAPWISLPVREPGRYAASAFRTIAARNGLDLPRPERGKPPEGAMVVAEHESEAVARIAAEMLYYSNNLTAEVLGLAAAEEPPPPGAALEEVAQGHLEALLGEEESRGARVLNLSGLTERSRISPLAFRSMLLAVLDPRRLPEVDIRFVLPLYDLKAEEAGLRSSAVVQAKSGTMHFVRTLAGYLHGSSCGRDFGFALFVADLGQRWILWDQLDSPVRAHSSQEPRAWRNRVREFERDILVHWVKRFGCG